jgi:hypothetical protein
MHSLQGLGQLYPRNTLSAAVGAEQMQLREQVQERKVVAAAISG